VELAPEVALASVGSEIGPDRQIGVKGDEVATPPVEPGHDSIPAHGLQNGSSGRSIAERLGATKILADGDLPEFRPMFPEMLVQVGRIPESDARMNDHQR
jgi:hypothetical protein